MEIEQYLTDDQDPKTAEKILGKLRDMLTSGEAVIYLAIQKKPAVTLIPDCIAVTNKRIIFCLPGNLGLTTNFITVEWPDVKEILFKEEFFGSKFITIPERGENISIDYIPKIQACKLYQYCTEQLEKQKELKRNQEIEFRKHANSPLPDAEQPPEVAVPEVSQSPADTEDEITLRLKKLKTLFEKQLISQEEYENKKADILSQF